MATLADATCILPFPTLHFVLGFWRLPAVAIAAVIRIDTPRGSSPIFNALRSVERNARVSAGLLRHALNLAEANVLLMLPLPMQPAAGDTLGRVCRMALASSILLSCCSCRTSVTAASRVRHTS